MASMDLKVSGRGESKILLKYIFTRVNVLPDPAEALYIENEEILSTRNIFH